MSFPLVLWQNTPSIHQAPLVRAVADRWSGDVTVVAEHDLPPARVRQGWHRPDFGRASLWVAPSREERLKLLIQFGHSGAVHIFSGLAAYPETIWTMRKAARTDVRMGVFSEPLREGDGLRALGRSVRYRLAARRWRRRLEFFLLTGERAVQQFSGMGFPLERLFPVPYVTSSDERVARQLQGDERCASVDGFRFVFVGQLVHWKGVDLLLKALGRNAKEGWVLEVIGDGPLKETLQGMATEYGMGGRVVWLGSLSNDEVKQRMLLADALVLPSRYDGWGAVVNEALQAGTRVVVSDACGAADLIQASSHGRVFEAESVRSLARELEVMLGMGEVTHAEREQIQTWAARNMSPGVIADYVVDILAYAGSTTGHRRPIPPWIREDASVGR